ncbi:phosphotransferase family protein [Marivita sp.]|jgi:aminoglycoside phosphotransferase (APT) family kinase protein|uniref:phosphotransferase family protein n=1 Tax=Marivita sp. TaxID=2003365 RepID=UPI00321A0377
MSTPFNTTAVEAWMAAHVPGFRGPIAVEKFATGQSNPTFKLSADSGTYVLRRKPPGQLLKSAHAVDREFRVQKALADSDVPVARMHALCEDDAVLGSMFYVMDHVPGRTFVDPRLPDATPEHRKLIFDDMNRVLAAIHSVDLAATGLTDYGPQGNYYQRQIDRWTKQYRATETDPIPDMDALMDWLARSIPEDDGRVTLVHGDYRIDNLLFAPDQPNCVAVLDWELSTLGHPFADLAAVIMQWGLPPGDAGRGLAGVEREPLGIPEDQAFIDAYCQRMDLPGIDRFGFYLAFTYFRMASILQGVKRRALDGNASNPTKALELGAYVPAFAKGGLKAAESV